MFKRARELIRKQTNPRNLSFNEEKKEAYFLAKKNFLEDPDNFRDPDESSFYDEFKPKKKLMKTTKVHNPYKEKLKNRLSEIENNDNKISNEIKNAMEKFNKKLNIEVHKPKKNLMKTTKVHNPHKEKLDKITKEVEEAFIKYTPKYIEHDKSLKPKNSILNKILELLRKALTYNEHVKLIQNAIKYVEKLNK